MRSAVKMAAVAIWLKPHPLFIMHAKGVGFQWHGHCLHLDFFDTLPFQPPHCFPHTMWQKQINWALKGGIWAWKFWVQPPEKTNIFEQMGGNSVDYCWEVITLTLIWIYLLAFHTAFMTLLITQGRKKYIILLPPFSPQKPCEVTWAENRLGVP